MHSGSIQQKREPEKTADYTTNGKEAGAKAEGQELGYDEKVAFKNHWGDGREGRTGSRPFEKLAAKGSWGNN